MALTVAALVTAGCERENLTAPQARDTRPSFGADKNILLSSPITIIPLQRTSPLAANEQRTATIGILGGAITLPSSGLRIVVPPFALTSPTTITATGLAGSAVAYELEPHGMSFLVPLVAIQDLRGTQASAGGLIDPLLLYVGYFPSSSNITSVTELLDLNVNLLGQTSAALLWHFSGYVWSSGRDESTPGDGQ
ncbi:MAG: hypothetical protein ACREBE_11340 [bacterium]